MLLPKSPRVRAPFCATLSLSLLLASAFTVRGGQAAQEPRREAEAPILAKSDNSAPRAWSDKDIAKLVDSDLPALGSLSLGFPNNGQLLNPVKPVAGKLFELVAEDYAWGTQETVDYLETAVRAVQEQYPDTLPLHMGHISKKNGGYLSPHLSHQSGRDVDLGFYYKSKRTWYRRATNDTLDEARTWALVKALITETDVEFIFIDHYVQILLKNYAKKIGEDEAWLHAVFVGQDGRAAIIRHARGHATHIHVRFFNPVAQENARRAYPYLLDKELIEPVVVYLHHRVRPGETLGRLAKRYGTSVKAIQQANGLRGTVIQARKTYKIPRSGGPAPVKGEIEIPARVLPPQSEG